MNSSGWGVMKTLDELFNLIGKQNAQAEILIQTILSQLAALLAKEFQEPFKINNLKAYLSVAMHMAAATGNTKVMSMILASPYVDPNMKLDTEYLKNAECRMFFKTQETPLYYAVMTQNAKTAMLLLSDPRVTVSDSVCGKIKNKGLWEERAKQGQEASTRAVLLASDKLTHEQKQKVVLGLNQEKTEEVNKIARLMAKEGLFSQAKPFYETVKVTEENLSEKTDTGFKKGKSS